MIRGSSIRREQYESVAMSQLYVPKQLILDCRTRWNSTADMIRVALEMRTPLVMVVATDENLQEHQLSHDEWDILAALYEFLDVSKRSETYLSINIILRNISKIGKTHHIKKGFP